MGQTFDKGFNREIHFDVPLAEGFRHRFLANRSPAPRVDRPFGLINPSLISTINRSTFDVLLVNGYYSVSCWIAYCAAVTKRLPYMLRGESHLGTEVGMPQLQRALKTTLLRPLIKKAACCLAIGEGNRRFYSHYGAPPRRIEWAPYSVDNDHFGKAGAEGHKHRSEILRDLHLDPRLPTVLFAAKLQPWKRPLDLVEAGHRLNGDINLIFVGDGPMRDQLLTKTANDSSTRVLGFVNQSEIGRLYGAADLFVLPSSLEPWGLAVNEAMAAGAVPLTSTAVGCGPDLVRPSSGCVFPVGDVRILARQMEELLSDRSGLQMMRGKAQQVVAGYSIEKTAAGIENGAIRSISEN